MWVNVGLPLKQAVTTRLPQREAVQAIALFIGDFVQFKLIAIVRQRHHVKLSLRPQSSCFHFQWD
jgi:hypothetical protein